MPQRRTLLQLSHSNLTGTKLATSRPNLVTMATNGHGPADPVINVAVVGVGEVAMTVHVGPDSGLLTHDQLPTLLLMSEKFKCTAIVDISKNALAHCGSKFGIARRFTDV